MAHQSSTSESFLIRLFKHPRKPSGPGAEASGALRDAGTPSCYTVITRVVTLLVVKETELKASKHFPSPPPVLCWSRFVPLCTLAVDSSWRLHPPLEHGDLGSSLAGPLLRNLHGGSFTLLSIWQPSPIFSVHPVFANQMSDEDLPSHHHRSSGATLDGSIITSGSTEAQSHPTARMC